jgi:hypothetical protein
MSIEDLERLAPEAAPTPLVAFLEGLHLNGLDLTREADAGRDVSL